MRRQSNAGYSDISGMYQPYRDAGMGAFNTYNDALGLNGHGGYNNAVSKFQTGPGYQFAFDQGQRAVENSGSARGLTQSGGMLKALTRYGQGVADQGWNSWLQNVGGVANTGYSATGATAGARNNLTNQLTGSLTAEGQGVANAELAGGSVLPSLLGFGARALGGTGFNIFGR